MTTRNRNMVLVSLFRKNLQQRELVYTIQNDRFKTKAYQQALQKLSALEEATSEIDEELLKKCNFGKSIGQKILYMFKNSRDLPENSDLSERDIAIGELMKIHNIGLKTALSLFDENHVKSVAMLKENTHLLNTKQLSGLKYHEDIQRRIPRQEIDLHRQRIHHLQTKMNRKFCFDIVGSYRRQAESSGDIDVLMYVDDDDALAHHIHPFLKQFVETMIAENYVPGDGVLALGDKKFMGVCRLSSNDFFRRIDILLTTKKEFPFCLLYFTGSKTFNILMREQATQLGLVLNEKQMTPKNNAEPRQTCMDLEQIKTEEDIFTVLNVKYVEPRLREMSHFRLK